MRGGGIWRRQRERQMGTEKVKVWQQHFALGLYIVIYVEIKLAAHVEKYVCACE